MKATFHHGFSASPRFQGALSDQLQSIQAANTQAARSEWQVKETQQPKELQQQIQALMDQPITETAPNSQSVTFTMWDILQEIMDVDSTGIEANSEEKVLSQLSLATRERIVMPALGKLYTEGLFEYDIRNEDARYQARKHVGYDLKYVDCYGRKCIDSNYYSIHSNYRAATTKRTYQDITLNMVTRKVELSP